MNLMWTEIAWADYEYWTINDKKILKKINQLIKDIKRTPFAGIGKPEALKFDLSGKWSRRIDQEHRLVYEISDATKCLTILQCRYHY
jgi:toxin YoeB